MVPVGLKIVWVYVHVKDFFRKLWKKIAIKSARFIPNFVMKKLIRSDVKLALVYNKNYIWSRTTELSWLLANDINYTDLCEYWKKTTGETQVKNAVIYVCYTHLIMEIDLENATVNYHTNIEEYEIIYKKIEFNRIETKMENIIYNKMNFGEDLLKELDELAMEEEYVELSTED